MEFTYTAYKNMVTLLIDKGYKITNYQEPYQEEQRIAVLRHDVDYSIDKALELARIENELNVTSTYFILLASEFYNILSKNNLQKINEIKGYGHDIGLHFDEVNYSKDKYKENGGIKNTILKEIDLLRTILDIDIKVVSMHRPSKETLEANFDLSPIINSYGEYFFKEFKYISDSRRRWRENADEIIESGKYNKLHILTHAFWYNDEEKGLKDSLLEFVETAKVDRYQILNENITNLKEVIDPDEIK